MVKVRAQHPSPSTPEGVPEVPPQQPITVDPQQFSFLVQQVQTLTRAVQQIQKREEQPSKEAPLLNALSQHSPQPAHQNEHYIDETDSEFAPSTLKVQRGDDLEHKVLDVERHMMELQVGDRSQNKNSFNL